MSLSEVTAYVKGVRRRGWEQARMIAYCCLRPWSKDLSPDDVLRLPWLDEEEQEDPEERKKRLEELRAMIPEITEKLKNDGK